MVTNDSAVLSALLGQMCSRHRAVVLVISVFLQLVLRIHLKNFIFKQ